MSLASTAPRPAAAPRCFVRADFIAFSTPAWVAAVVLIIACWVAVRWLFFLGLAGSDDLHHLRFALTWDHVPVNHWEARLLTNALAWLSVQLFGFSELAVTLPSALGSLGLLAGVLIWCGRHYGLRAMWTAGLLVALLPLDVGLATTVSATPIMSAFAATGTILFLWEPSTPLKRSAAALCLALAVVTHLSALYYVAALCLAALIIDRRRFRGAALATIVAGLAVLCIEAAIFWTAYRDPLLPFRVAADQSQAALPLGPVNDAGRFHPWFLLWPLQQLLCSQALGIAFLAAAGLALWRWRSLDTPHRALLLAGLLFWLWISFGTQVPWAYRPFHRLTRFWHPLILAMTAILALSFAARRSRWLHLLRLAVLATCVLSLVSAGSWGQNVRVSQELLAYARAHPQTAFLTDRKTAYEIRVLCALHPPANIAPLTAGPIEHECGALLVNPLNLPRDPRFAAFCDQHAGPFVYETQPAYREICRVVPLLRTHAWAIRKPPARVCVYTATR